MGFTLRTEGFRLEPEEEKAADDMRYEALVYQEPGVLLGAHMDLNRKDLVILIEDLCEWEFPTGIKHVLINAKRNT